MSRKITVLLKNLSKHWFILSFFAISLAVLFVSFFKVFELKDFLVEFPESCDVDSNTCVEVDGELSPSRFILLKESYFLKNCENKDFDECMKRCETDSACTTETNKS
ncbi:hypothetical protein A3G48_02215 [Candidatus Nomurabacteria bacterium RIFCSPLOWO2_12_FULL_40_42]|uniref:Uncharacterized protein n=1 Tax=Candidatus Nomurabacteria bacterium RIFCSPLOWO2_02_FULL_40_67 TaxID=1801787 RepID=A0A1F6Y7I0_9BACT|nr:MAG: hypothetical protein UU01_C0032G0009 [Parcubacteria group bacterium GW2011_GWA2_40_37]OGI72910.1 MAG: hypothetical protein A2W56_00480 [Candidatus Nomurabacteria bacterium RIFCSPHIGHO2_02_41_18]OGJ02323.1 MAG: hypothetical protein A3I23_02910 [Candidatus Nomurabacteria bacterium RIFCSPLOWO2_02_FULL_40_67]OGJ04090.1 MAG: hypothetical protein A3G48_02215 [Candidatus Nomurabacteria bacterium RIFCSPLOWO2_12_FULL_40_42]